MKVRENSLRPETHLTSIRSQTYSNDANSFLRIKAVIWVFFSSLWRLQWWSVFGTSNSTLDQRKYLDRRHKIYRLA